MRRLSRVSQWWLFLAVGIALTAAFSFAFEGRQAGRAALRYLSIWESEIARSMLTGENAEESAKLLAQIEEFHPSLKVRASAAAACPWPIHREISLYSLPAAEVTICRDRSVVLRQALLSPVFLGALGLLFALSLIASGREHRARLLRLAAEAKADSESQRAELARQVAHDIRDPLSALNMLAKNSGSLPEAERELLSQVSSRINDIADDLLKNSRALPGPAETVRVGLCLIDETLSALKAEMEARFQNHVLEWSLAAPVSVPLSAASLQRVVSNLVQNSVEASETGGRVMVATRSGADFVSLLVADAGRGIPEEILARLGHEELTHGKENGNGLGLREARRLVDHTGGLMRIQSRVGVGTQIELRWPREAQSSITNPSSSSSVF